VPHLLQYVSNSNYYGRIKLNGKVIRESLETGVWTTAKLKLTDFLKERLEGRNKANVSDRPTDLSPSHWPLSATYDPFCPTSLFLGLTI
jgi:hypothetical protein